MSTESPTPSGTALRSIREAVPRLNPTMRRVAEVILADPLAAGSSSITALAETAQAAPATVSRFAARLGYGGFPALRSAIALENGRNVQSEWERDIGTAITPEDSSGDVLGILAGTAARALRDAVSMIDVAQVERAAAVIAQAERVHLYGEWGDSVALRELHIRLQRIGVAAWFHEGGTVTLSVLCNTMTDRDAVVVLNRSGEDEVAHRFQRGARAAGATSIAIHGAPESPLAADADVPVFSGIRNGEVWTQYYAGRASDTLVASLLWVLVAQRRSAHETMRFFDDGMLHDIAAGSPDPGRSPASRGTPSTDPDQQQL